MRKKICFVTAISGSAQSFLKDHIEALRKDYDVYYACNYKDEKELAGLNLSGFHRIEIHREISIKNDLIAVFQLMRYLRKMRFDAVHSVTPKAGLITALASWLARIPHRTHIFTGQVWATAHGTRRWMLKTLDKVTATLDNHVMVDGMSQRQFIIDEGVVSEKKSLVLGDGSICGVNTSRFCPNSRVREEWRKKLNLGQDKLVYILLGRMNHDKGVGDLMEAYNRLAGECSNTFLLLVGNNENGYMESLPRYDNLNRENFLYYGATPEPQLLLQAADIFVLPTYREGFGSSVIEAQCLGLPVVCSDAYGVMDAMVDEETGLRCHVGDVDGIYKAMKRYHDQRSLIKEHGDNGRKRVLDKFTGERLTKCWVEYYHKLFLHTDLTDPADN